MVAATALGLGGRLVGDALYQSENGGVSWTKVADVSSVINQLVADGGVVFAASANGLARYGTPVERPATTLAGANWSALANPTGVQVLILVLTVAVAGLALTIRRDWLVRRSESAC